ncbi:MAG TPA: toll/interleukin-1 receptor domain-containing protein [Blastocatellia bacterium]
MLSNEILIIYSHKDKHWLEMLKAYLKPYLRGDLIRAWDDTKIRVGDDWKETINQAQASAKRVILLVSADFLASDFMYEKVLPYLLKAANEKQITVIPVAVRPSAWKTTPLGSIKWANDPERPLSQLGKMEREKELLRISELIASDMLRSKTVVSESQFAEEGVKALFGLIGDPRLHKKLAILEAAFKISYGQIDELAYYMNLHDLLHTLQFQCYNSLIQIVRTARRDPDDTSFWDSTVMYEIVIQSVLAGFHKAAQQASQGRAVPHWIPKLIQDLDVLSQAIEQNDAERIDIAIRPIQRVLAMEPPVINYRLVAVAEGMEMAVFINALSIVCSSLYGARINPIVVRRLINSLQEIKELNESLPALIDSHNKWQEIDIVLRRIELNMSIDFSDLENSWDELKTLVETQCDGCEEIWAQSLKKEIGKLDQALTDRDANRVRLHFMSFRTRASYRFYEVGVALKELFSQLRKVGETLTTVLEILR